MIDYPHWDFDRPDTLNIPPSWRENVFDLNARKVYKRLPPKQESSASDLGLPSSPSLA